MFKDFYNTLQNNSTFDRALFDRTSLQHDTAAVSLRCGSGVQ